MATNELPSAILSIKAQTQHLSFYHRGSLMLASMGAPPNE